MDATEEQQQPQEAAPAELQQVEDAPAEHAGADGADPMASLSKTQRKKLMKRQLAEERKKQRKAEEKARRQAEQERRRQEGRERLAAMSEEERQKHIEERNARGVARKAERQGAKARMEQALVSGQRICVDLAFSDLMLDQENKSMCKQLGYCWHANIQAATPAHLVLTSMEGQMEEYMARQVSGYKNWKATITPQPYIEHFADCKDKLVYLTADSESELQELDPEHIYIIGGIVDRNRHKQLCFNKAEEQGIAHARLPIGDYMRLASSTVMTTNHVFEIMLKWLELRDWKAAFEAVIPSRKRKQDEGEEHDGAGEEQDQGQAEEQQQQPAEQQQQDQQQGEQQEAEQPPAKRQAVAEQS
ncbi:hypothetical protein COHA_002425 [Chlorella ohadii]|uniref:tRNA (guanine(9)-N(1))-methyltransferase n=1 Tax=Chlorella ohadii TaxID=2649997 RepID=A0AAD5DWJ4_9CHLO|nr:hypothetical protein COHA_002425 [Chlorella ohadii]